MGILHVVEHSPNRPSGMVKALWNGAVIAESDDTIIMEKNHYFPLTSITNPSILKESSKTTTCGWKGLCSYYTVSVNEKENEDAAFEYKNPKPAAAALAGRVAFWKGVEIQE